MKPEIESALRTCLAAARDEDGSDFYYLHDTGKPIRRVAFYDRASARHQERNPMRLATSHAAASAAERHGWELRRSYDPRNGGICFLDVNRRDTFSRQEFERATLLDVDAIGVMYADRLGEGRVPSNLAGIAAARGKSLICFDLQALAFAERLASMLLMDRLPG